MAARKKVKAAAEKLTEVNTADMEKAETKAVKKAEAKAEGTKKTEKKSAAKTSAKGTRKPAARKEMKVSAFVEYHDKKVEEKTIIADVKKAWTKSGGKVGEIKTMDLYIKPEEDAVYYVINGTETGSVAF